MINSLFPALCVPTPPVPSATRTPLLTPTPTPTLGPTLTPTPTPSSQTGLLLLSEDWADNQLANRGWTDGTGFIGTGYNIVNDSTLGANCLEIKWDGNDPQPYGATSLQKFVAASSSGVTVYCKFWANTIATTDTMSHFLRLLQNWTLNYGGFGPSPNQINILELGPAVTHNVGWDPVYHRSVDTYRSAYFTGGSYGSACCYLDTPYVLTSSTWYDYRVFCQPQITSGSTGKIQIDIKPISGSTWTRIVNQNNVILTDTTGIITKFAIGPYRSANTAADRFRVGSVRVYSGDFTAAW